MGDVCALSKYRNANPLNYLAIATQTQNGNANEKSSPASLLQIWRLRKDFRRKARRKNKGNVVELKWRRAPRKHRNALLHYGVALSDGGAVRDVKWLPFRIAHKLREKATDNRNEKYQRLGVLGVVASDGAVRIFSLPFSHSDGVVIDIAPIAVLRVTNLSFS